MAKLKEIGQSIVNGTADHQRFKTDDDQAPPPRWIMNVGGGDGAIVIEGTVFSDSSNTIFTLSEYSVDSDIQWKNDFEQNTL